MTPPPRTGQALSDEAVALMREGKFAAAEAAFLMLLEQEPRNAGAHYLVGLTVAQAGRFEDGVGHIRRAIGIDPGNAMFHLNLAVALRELGRDEEALDSLDKALALEPNSVPAYYHRAVTLLKLMRLDQAIAALESTIRLQPDFADAHSDLGYAYARMGRLEEALAARQQALNLNPGSAAYLTNVAMSLCDMRRHAQALPLLERVLEITPGDETVLLLVAQALLGLNRPQEGLVPIEKVIAAHPRDLKAKAMRASALIRLRRLEEALMIAEEMRNLAPQDALSHLAHAQAMVQLNRLEAALASYDQAIRLDPDDTDAIWGRALALLTLGRFEDGWAAYEVRKRKPELFKKPIYAGKPWLGEERLKDKRLYVFWEQGLGDTINFARYVLLAAEQGAKVAFSVQDSLLRLFRESFPHITVMDANGISAEADLNCALLSLPMAFGTRLETIPSMPGGYLKAPAADVALWQQKLAPAQRRIGLVWSGNTTHLNDANRSIPLARLQRLLRPDVTWVSLQKEVREADRPTFEASSLMDPSADLRDFADTAALISALDLVITVDTSVAHLAGALGKPCWVMLPYAPDFRWLLHREDSPWYPSMRLFRQQSPGEWGGLIKQIGEALSHDFTS